MKYFGMPLGMWLLFGNSFKKNMEKVLGFNAKSSTVISANAKQEYKRIIKNLPEFEKDE